ncbi:MAG: PQQ-binding-like beta-propeller repeat protein [Pseudomonadota bacterium]
MKPRFKWLSAAAALALMGVGVYVWTDLQSAPVCLGEAAARDPYAPVVLSGWGFDAANTRAVPETVQGIGPRDWPHLTVQWAFRFPWWTNKARSQPAVTADTIYVGSQRGWVYALNRWVGCVRWKTFVGAEVRTGMVLGGAGPGGERLLFFGDFNGNVHALDAGTGAHRWKVAADTHRLATVTGTPALYDGRLYVPVSSIEVAVSALPVYPCCTFRGSVHAFDAATGASLWQTFTTEPSTPRDRNALFIRRWGPSGAPIWSAPTIDVARKRLYVGTGENYSQPTNTLSDAILALDLEDGRILWSRQFTARDAWNMSCILPGGVNCPENAGRDLDFGASPVLARGADGRDVLVAGQKSGVVYGIDPEDGVVRWSRRLGRGGPLGGVHWGLAARDGRVFVPISDYLKPIPGLKAPQPEDPALPKAPGLYALDAATGRVLWAAPVRPVCPDAEQCYPGLSAAVTAMSEGIVAATLDGRVQVYDSDTGELLWERPTARGFRAVDGRLAHGGAIDAGGAIVAGSQLIVNSGYGLFSQAPGNVLLVYGAPNRASHQGVGVEK